MSNAPAPHTTNRVLRPIAPDCFAVIVDDVNLGVVAKTPLGFGWMAGANSELVSPEPRHRTAGEAAAELLERLEDEAAAAAEPPTCPSCDGIVAAGAVTCPCGAVIDEDAFWVDHMAGATFEERMALEVTLENEERALYGAAPLGGLS